jgi:hypothetical protein
LCESKIAGSDIFGACTISTLDFVVSHHASILVLEIVTVIKERARVILEADKYLDLFTWHNQYRIFPSIVDKPRA